MIRRSKGGVRRTNIRFLFCLLIAVGLIALVDPLTYVFLVRWYRENPEAEKTTKFEQLDTVFRRKYVKAISIVIGIICLISAFIVLNLYVLPTL